MTAVVESLGVESLVVRAREALARLDPAVLGPDRCAALVGELSGLGKACAAAQARLAAAATAAYMHRRAGCADGAEWLAAHAGSSAIEAKKAMATAKAAAETPVVALALAAGELSLAQATAITAAAAADPSSADRLVDLARRKPLRVLQEEARRVQETALAPDVLAARHRAARSFRHWQDGTGMVCFRGSLPPAEGARVLHRLDQQTERRRRAARKDKCEEGWEYHAADAVVDLLGSPPGEGMPGRGRSEVVFVVDLRAWRRGEAEPGEPCHVLGGGRVDVNEIRRVFESEDPFVKAVTHDGVAVQHVVHWGRHIPAAVRTVLMLGPPPTFAGSRCACGCGRRHKLQYDHVHPLAAGGPTALANLQPLTPGDHGFKTAADRAAGLLGGQARPP